MIKSTLPRAIAMVGALAVTGGVLAVADHMHTTLYSPTHESRLDATLSCGALHSALHSIAHRSNSCARVG